jgi:uncharacterized protein (TIGR02147 family)
MSMGYIDIFRYRDYKKYVKDRVFEMPHNGKGQFRKIGTAAGMHTSLVSQVFSGERELSPEQAVSVSGFLGLAPLEQEYFTLLVQRERAGSTALRELTESTLQRLKQQAESGGGRVLGAGTRSSDEQFTEEAKALFYSQWYYSAARLLSWLPGGQTVDGLAEKLQLSSKKSREIVEFLVRHDLCEIRQERIFGKAGSIYLGENSQHVHRHMQNWRLKGIERIGNPQQDDYAYTLPMAVSRAGAEKIRRKLIECVAEVRAIMDEKDDPEVLTFLNLDWFQV